jgi:hypothetical protein
MKKVKKLNAIWINCKICEKPIKIFKSRIGVVKYCSKKCFSIGKKSQSINLNQNNGQWKGDKAKIHTIHQWVRLRKPRPLFCERCNIRYPYDLANKSGLYYRDINDFEWLCRKCHMTEDGRLKQFIKMAMGGNDVK